MKATAPAAEDIGMSHGALQAHAVFAMPGRSTLYATPLGLMQGDREMYFCDRLYYYDDPHTIYDNWPKDVWAAIDAHQVKPDMNELQTRTSIGYRPEYAIGRWAARQPDGDLQPGGEALDHHLCEGAGHGDQKRITGFAKYG